MHTMARSILGLLLLVPGCQLDGGDTDAPLRGDVPVADEREAGDDTDDTDNHSDERPSEDGAAEPPPVTAAEEIELNFLYIHGVKGCESDRLNSENSLDELQAAVDAALPAAIASYEAAHPGVTLVTSSAHANLYTARGSGIQPSDSPDPLLMDDWEVGDPGCDATVQGEPCTTAYEWRYRLASEIEDHFPADARNVILVAHSTGARAAFEVAASVGPDGVGTDDWGVEDKIAGVVSVQGMVDEIGSSKYNVIGPFSFDATCKNSDPILGFGDSCGQGNGWCEYAGRVSGFPAADWVADNKLALMLTSFASCSPSLFTGFTDGPLPFDAQASPRAVGVELTAAPGKTFRAAHGVQYGSFCHSAVVAPAIDGHVQAVSSARDRILDWLFVEAPRIASAGEIETDSIGRNRSTPTFTLGDSCPEVYADGGADVAGLCRHPGFFDGADHIIADSELTLNDGPSCDATVRWTQSHASGNHPAELTWKTYSLPTGGGLVDGLLTSG